MDNLKIKFYNEMEACSYANRFTTEMTLGELKQKVLNNEFPIIEHEAYAIDFDSNIKGKVLDINGMKVFNVVTEDSRKVEINLNQSPITIEVSEYQESPWAWGLELICKNKELEQENENLKQQLKQQGS